VSLSLSTWSLELLLDNDSVGDVAKGAVNFCQGPTPPMESMRTRVRYPGGGPSGGNGTLSALIITLASSRRSSGAPPSTTRALSATLGARHSRPASIGMMVG
jgi:hypothetical protein